MSDVLPGSPAETAGVLPQDIVTAVNGTATEIVPMFGLAMAEHDPGDTVTLSLLRGTTALSVKVSVIEGLRSDERLAVLRIR